MTDLLGNWRRTHYSRELDDSMDGESVILMGWVHEIRDLGGIIFVLLRDRNGITQIHSPQ